jgi:hypothetical protein
VAIENKTKDPLADFYLRPFKFSALPDPLRPPKQLAEGVEIPKKNLHFLPFALTVWRRGSGFPGWLRGTKTVERYGSCPVASLR